MEQMCIFYFCSINEVLKKKICLGQLAAGTRDSTEHIEIN